MALSTYFANVSNAALRVEAELDSGVGVRFEIVLLFKDCAESLRCSQEELTRASDLLQSMISRARLAVNKFSPINSLSDEALALVFGSTVLENTFDLEADDIWQNHNIKPLIDITHVCSRWRRVILQDMPHLWSIVAPPLHVCMHTLSALLERSAPLPIHLVLKWNLWENSRSDVSQSYPGEASPLSVGSSMRACYPAVLHSHANRIESLCVLFNESHAADVASLLNAGFPQAKRLRLQSTHTTHQSTDYLPPASSSFSTPRLSHIFLKGLNLEKAFTAFPNTNIVHITLADAAIAATSLQRYLKGATRMQTCTLTQIELTSGSGQDLSSVTESVTLPSVQQLVVQFSGRGVLYHTVRDFRRRFHLKNIPRVSFTIPEWEPSSKLASWTTTFFSPVEEPRTISFLGSASRLRIEAANSLLLRSLIISNSSSDGYLYKENFEDVVQQFCCDYIHAATVETICILLPHLRAVCAALKRLALPRLCTLVIRITDNNELQNFVAPKFRNDRRLRQSSPIPSNHPGFPLLSSIDVQAVRLPITTGELFRQRLLQLLQFTRFAEERISFNGLSFEDGVEPDTDMDSVIGPPPEPEEYSVDERDWLDEDDEGEDTGMYWW
ncbi:hypothetical protein BKA62DRAFT_697838 [Auriculariales sp. MPI-PUGE-AT-0066]|nr:hypothetical protein BKA62DRAFT_697838 [Auriculariales sp. MPI-PUGE-AT-0066]